MQYASVRATEIAQSAKEPRCGPAPQRLGASGAFETAASLLVGALGATDAFGAYFAAVKPPEADPGLVLALHCYIFAEGCADLATMPFEQAEKVFADCMRMCDEFGRDPYFYLTGGDPLLHSDFWRIAETPDLIDLVGIRDLRDTLRCVEHGGIVCLTGILGGVYAWDGFGPIKDIPNGVYLTGFFSYYPTQELFDAAFSFMKHHMLRPVFDVRFAFDDLPAALDCQDAGSGGKIVVVHG